MRYLIISIALFLVSCGSYPKKSNFQTVEIVEKTIVNPYFSDSAKDYVYKADINLYKKKFSGIFIVKKTGKDQHRVVFTTEMGNKIFDFTYDKSDFKVNFILDKINKKVVVNVLRKDFKVLLKENPTIQSSFSSNDMAVFETEINKKKHYYHFDHPNGRLIKIVRTANGKEKVKFLFSEINDNIAKNIQILHENFQFRIRLKAI